MQIDGIVVIICHNLLFAYEENQDSGERPKFLLQLRFPPDVVLLWV